MLSFSPRDKLDKYPGDTKVLNQQNFRKRNRGALIETAK